MVNDFTGRDLFNDIWTPEQSFAAFIGYSLNQRKKFLDKNNDHSNKFAVAYIRVLLQLNQLLAHCDFKLEVVKEWKETFIKIKNNFYLKGQIVDMAEKLTELAEFFKKGCVNTPHSNKVNTFLLDMRKKYWG